MTGIELFLSGWGHASLGAFAKHVHPDDSRAAGRFAERLRSVFERPQRVALTDRLIEEIVSALPNLTRDVFIAICRGERIRFAEGFQQRYAIPEEANAYRKLN